MPPPWRLKGRGTVADARSFCERWTSRQWEFLRARAPEPWWKSRRRGVWSCRGDGTGGRFARWQARSSPPPRLRRCGAASFACQRLAWFTEPKLAGGERRMVDLTGIEPVTS